MCISGLTGSLKDAISTVIFHSPLPTGIFAINALSCYLRPSKNDQDEMAPSAFMPVLSQRAEKDGALWGIVFRVYRCSPALRLVHNMRVWCQRQPEEDIDSTGMKLQRVESCHVGAEN